MGFEAVPDALRAAGRAGEEAVGEIRNADCGAPVADVSAALPGTTSAGAATSFARSWKTTFFGWCDAAGQQAASLIQAADSYIAGDDSANSSLPRPSTQGPF